MNFLEKDEEELEADVEIILDKKSETVKKYADPFMSNDLQSIPRPQRRKFERLAKKMQGIGETGSKYISPESISSYDIFQVVTPPYNLDYLAKLYEINVPHHAAVNAKAVNVAGLGYDIIESQTTQLKIEKMQGTRKRLEDFALSLKAQKIKLHEKLDSLNDEEELSEMLTKVWVDVESIGNGYLEISRNRNGEIGYLGHIPAPSIRVRAARDGYLQLIGNKYVFFRNYGDTETVNPLGTDDHPNEIMHFKKYSPKSTYYGVPDIVAALPAVNGDFFAKAYNLDFFENKAVPRYAFITKGVRLSQQAEERLINYFQNELKGKHHGTLYIPLPASINQNVDAKFEPIENRPQDQSFNAYIEDARLEILIAHRVPPSKVGVYSHTNLAVSRDADKTFKEQVIQPEQRRLEKKINKLFIEFSAGVFIIKLGESDIIDADVRSRMHDRYLRTRVEKPNEVRKELGYPSVPEGEEFLPVPGTLTAGNTPVGAAQGNRARSTDTGQKPQSDGGAQRAERGAEQSRGAQPRTN